MASGTLHLPWSMPSPRRTVAQVRYDVGVAAVIRLPSCARRALEAVSFADLAGAPLRIYDSVSRPAGADVLQSSSRTADRSETDLDDRPSNARE